MDYPEYDNAPAEEEVSYPDIDETVQYPWQSHQQAMSEDALDTSVLDPRLYRDLNPDVSQYSDKHLYGDEYQDDGFQDSDESLYELSEEEKSTYVHSQGLGPFPLFNR